MVNARALAMHALVSLARGRVDRLRTALDDGQLDSREHAFAFELAHGVLRRRRLLDLVLEGLAHRGVPKDQQLRTALQLGVYQLLFVAGMPAHAAVHETVELVRNNRGFANALLRGLSRAIDHREADPTAVTTELALGPTRVLRLPKPLPGDEAERLAIVHSLPDFLVSRWLEQFGIEGVRQIAAAASTEPGVFLRAAAGVESAALQLSLQAHGVEVTTTDHARLLRWTGGSSPFATPAFAAGQFVVQDPTAMRAAEAVPAAPGDTILDLCAAPGTKTTLLAERVRPGRVFAFDIDVHRRERIAENVARLRLGDVVQIVEHVSSLPAVDAVLADVPCSNSGVLGRRVEVRDRLQPGTFAQMASTQRKLLAQAIALTRPGGAVVYSTCSIDREENDGVVAAVLADAAVPRCEVVSQATTLPAAGAHDGGFCAVLRRLP